MIYKVDFEGQACKQIKEKAESYQYDLKSVLKGIGLLIADMWLPGDSKPQINTWEGLFEKVQEDYSYKDTIVENDFICSISNDDGISIIIEIADETIVDFKDIKSSILQVRDFLLANKWSGAIPDFLPIEQKEIRNMMNETERSIPFKCLHEAFFECAYRFPDKTALEWLSLDEKWETLSYEALKIKVLQTASMLKQEGVHTNSTNDFVTKVWGNILTKEIITKSVVPDLLKSIDLKQIKILDYAQELCPPDVKGQVYVSESEIMNDRNKTYYKILEHPLYGRMADTGIIGVLTHDGYMEFVVPNCETSVETPDKKEDTHEEEIEKPIVKEIMKIWKEVFEIEDISIQDDFYTLGGDSIILMRLVDEMCKTLGCDVTVDDILQSENISDLANRV